MTFDIQTGLYAWPIVIFICLVVFKKTSMPNSGLVFAYITSLMINHFFGGLIYTFPWANFPDPESVARGFEMSTYAVIFFGIGAVSLPLTLKTFQVSFKPTKMLKPNNNLPFVYGVTGILFFYVLRPVLSRIPSFATFVGAGWSLLVISICLFTWRAWLNGRKKVLRWLALALILPVITVVGSGFLGFGAAAVAVCFIFFGTFYRPKWKVWTASVIVLYLSLSLFVTYMRERGDLRQAIWYEKQTLFQKMEKFSKIFTDFEFLDIHNEQHLERIDSRLNQNFLVGKSMDYIAQGAVDLAHGQTISDALLAVIPRIIWPDKPFYGGSGTIVSDYTGIEFAQGTSIGVGQVMEFYINFGKAGVCVGFAIYGILVAMFDLMSGLRLKEGDWPGFSFWFLSGMGFIQAGGSLIEVAGTVASSLVFCVFLNKYILQKYKGTVLNRLRFWDKKRAR